MASRESLWMLLLPVAGLALVLALTWQGLSSAAEHRRAAEAVLCDYAELAAEEFVRRSANEVGYYGFFPLIVVLAEGLAFPDQPLTAAERMIDDAGGRTEQQKDLIKQVFRQRQGEPLEMHSASSELKLWLNDRLTNLPALDETPYGVMHQVIGGQQRLLVYAQGADALIGFEVERRALASRLQRSFERGPLLPASLGRTDTTRQFLQVRVRDSLGVMVTQLGQNRIPNSGPYAEQLTMTVPYGDSYHGVLEGYSVSVTIDPEAAEDLVIGGLPASRLPLLAGLAVLAVGFLLATIWLAGKERAMARLRTDFIARVSHELRTPLTQIRIFAETLLLGRLPQPEEQQRALTIIDREARRLSHLVDNILRFSRGERGMILNRVRRPLVPLLNQIVDRIRPLIVDQTLVVDNSLAEDLQLSLDGDALHQILLNLLDNAIKYGPSSQRITLRWRRTGEVVRLSVSDQGPGVPSTERERVWKNFERLERSTEQSIAGTGIGLSVVRELVDLHGGRSWVEDGLADGARFVVELPIADSATRIL